MWAVCSVLNYDSIFNAESVESMIVNLMEEENDDAEEYIRVGPFSQIMP